MATFKKDYSAIVDTIQTECNIFSTTGNKFHTDNALWDTGADTTIISPRIVKELHLHPHKQGGITGIGGASDTNIYLVHIQIPTGEVVTYVEVMESDFNDYDVIIGMDVINFGDFLITNANNHTTFQFRTPSEGGIEL